MRARCASGRSCIPRRRRASPRPRRSAPRAADEDWREINAKMWKWLHCHPYNDMLGDGLPEDERTWAFDFRVMTPTAWWRVPMQNLVMGLPTDAAAQYRIHKMMLQQLPVRAPEEVLGAQGLSRLPAEGVLRGLSRTPSLVWLHRDPVQVAASRTMMMADIMEGIVGKVDLMAEAKKHLERTRASIANTMSNPLVDDPRIHHVRYKDFVADPIGTIRGYYEFAGRELTAAGGSGDARLPRQQQGRPPRQVRLLDQAADRRRRGHRRAATRSSGRSASASASRSRSGTRRCIHASACTRSPS